MCQGDQPDNGDIVLFTAKESERSRNIKYKFGRIKDVDVEGRGNKVRIVYRNNDETVMREIERSIKDVVLILGVDEIDFNTTEHCIAATIQRKYLMTQRQIDDRLGDSCTKCLPNTQ